MLPLPHLFNLGLTRPQHLADRVAGHPQVPRDQAEATGLADASQQSRVAVSALGTELSDVTASARDARSLLDALGKLIDSVERYIRPAA